jgi:hypothetical protein
VEDTLIWQRQTHMIWLLISKIESLAIAAPRNLWLSTWRCPIELATKANSLLAKREHKQEQRRYNLKLQMKVLAHKLEFHKLNQW